jgi:hypothetical protein
VEPTYQPPPAYEPPAQPAYQPPPPPPPPPPAPYRAAGPAAPWWSAPGARLLIALIMFITGVAVFFVSSRSSKAAAAGEIFLEGSDVPGRSTFTPSIAAAPPATKAATATTTPAASTGGPAKAVGSAPGLYGGQRDVPSCNATALVSYLEANPTRARPWAAALGINAADIKAYVATLTPALLRVDTRATDYGFANGRAVPRQSVLQAGTAVFLDRTAFPRIRCQSGDPLGEAQAVTSAPTYQGVRWPGFSPATIIVVVPAPTTVTIVLVDIVTGAIFVRIPGSIVIIDIERPPDGTVLVIVEPGGPARITGVNWPPGTQVTITFDNPPVTLGTATADGAGNIAADVTIPLDAVPGVHTVTIAGGGFTVTQPVYVIPRAPAARLTPG